MVILFSIACLSHYVFMKNQFAIHCKMLKGTPVKRQLALWLIIAYVMLLVMAVIWIDGVDVFFFFLWDSEPVDNANKPSVKFPMKKSSKLRVKQLKKKGGWFFDQNITFWKS